MSIECCLLNKKLLDALVHAIDLIDCNPSGGCVEHEGIYLSHGDHVVTFKTDFQPTEVYVSLNPEGGTPVCSGNLSNVSTSLLDDGFVLYAHIAEDSAVVKWIIKK